MVELYAVKITQPLNENSYADLVQWVNPERRTLVGKFRNPEDASRSLFGELLLRSILISRLGFTNESISFGYTVNQKPFLLNNERIHFNLAHSGTWVICAFDSAPIGIDVEEIKPRELEDVKESLSEEEWRSISGAPQKQRLSLFYKLWTIKESYLKAVGDGLTLSPGSVTIRLDKHDAAQVIRSGKTVEDIYFKTFHLDQHHPVAVCSFTNQPISSISFRGVDEITQAFSVKQAHA